MPFSSNSFNTLSTFEVNGNNYLYYAINGHQFTTAENYFAAISSQDTAVALSGQLRTLAVALMKIANDLRWMSSRPLAG